MNSSQLYGNVPWCQWWSMYAGRRSHQHLDTPGPQEQTTTPWMYSRPSSAHIRQITTVAVKVQRFKWFSFTELFWDGIESSKENLQDKCGRFLQARWLLSNQVALKGTQHTNSNQDSKETCLFKVKFWSSVTPSILMVYEKGIEVPVIIGDATGGRVHRRWQVPIRIDSDLVLLRARPLWQNQLCKADRQSESNDCCGNKNSYLRLQNAVTEK